MTRLVSRAMTKVKQPKHLSKPDAILARDVVEVVMPLASLVLMALLVNHGVNALANHVDDVMTIQRANLVTMTKLMLLMKPELLRRQLSFDDFLADDATRAPRSDRTREPRDNDSTREPCDDESEATETPIQARRNLGQRRGRGGDATGEPRADGVTREPRSERTREPRRRRDDDSTREPCDDDEADVTDEAGATEAPVQLRRLLGGRGRGGRRGRDRDADVTGEPLADDATRAPRSDRTREPRDNDSTREPCDDESEATEMPIQARRNLGQRRGRGGDATGEPRADGVTREPRSERTRQPRDVTKEPCEGEDCDDDEADVTDEAGATEAP